MWCNNFSISSHRGMYLRYKQTPKQPKTIPCTDAIPSSPQCRGVFQYLHHWMKPVSQKWQFWSCGNREGEHAQPGMEDSPDKPLPAGKLAVGHRSSGVCQLGLQNIQSQVEPRKACSTEWNVSSASFVQMPEVPKGSGAGQPGAAQGVRKADTGPHQAAETGRQRDWLARQWKISLNIWDVWSPRCSPHSLVLSLFVWGFPPAFPLCNIPFPCYFGTERKETAGRKTVKIPVLFNTDKGFYTRLICKDVFLFLLLFALVLIFKILLYSPYCIYATPFHVKILFLHHF